MGLGDLDLEHITALVGGGAIDVAGEGGIALAVVVAYTSIEGSRGRFDCSGSSVTS